MLVIYDSDLVVRLAAEQERYYTSSRLLILATWEQRSFGAKVVQNVARLLSPLL
jgi:hypothetical protein